MTIRLAGTPGGGTELHATHGGLPARVSAAEGEKESAPTCPSGVSPLVTVAERPE